MFLIIKQIVKNMVELDKPVTMANYIFILLSTMMTSIAFNHVILGALTTKGKCPKKETPTIPTIPNQEIQDLHQIKLKIEEKVIELKNIIDESNAICPNVSTNSDSTKSIAKMKARNKASSIHTEYEELLKQYTEYTDKTDAKYKKIFKFKNLEGKEIPLDLAHDCESNTNDTTYFVKYVQNLFDTLKVSNDNTGCTKNNEKEEVEAEFTNTSFEGFGDDKYELNNNVTSGEKGKLKNDTYTKNITNGSIAVYIFSVLISIAGFIFHTHAYHIMGAIMNMIISAMGLHLWTIYHDKENSVEDIDVDYMSSLISASWALCILTFTVFIFVYLNEESAY